MSRRFFKCVGRTLPLLALNFAAAVSFFFQSGCNRKGAAAAGQGARPPSQVIVAEAKRQSISETLALVGSVSANESVEIKSETDGIIETIEFQEGQRVEKG